MSFELETSVIYGQYEQVKYINSAEWLRMCVCVCVSAIVGAAAVFLYFTVDGP